MLVRGLSRPIWANAIFQSCCGSARHEKSRFPSAKIVKSTKGSQVIPAIEDIYNAYGNPDSQLSNNGPPFNSKEMKEFAETRNFEQSVIPPLHPQSNPVETFMKLLGKAMKIAAHNEKSEQGALSQLLNDYRCKMRIQ